MGVSDGNVSSGSGNGGNLYGLTPEQATREFDTLRREATKLERHLEDRVARYQQVRARVVCAVFLVGVREGGEGRWDLRFCGLLWLG